MKRLAVIAAVIFAVLIVNSLAPLAWLYAKKDVAQPTNETAAATLKNNTGEHFAFIVFGDNHTGFPLTDSATLKIFRRMNREDRFKKLPIDFVANLGDVSFYHSHEANYRLYNKLRSILKWPVINVMGNHDAVGGTRYFHKYLGKSEFSFVDRNSYFIVLESWYNDITDAQFAWLESELKKSAPYKHRFLFMHKLPVSLYQRSWFRPELSSWSYRLMKLCEKYNVDIVFAGHEHMFQERTFGKVQYIISGGGGMMTQVPESSGGFLHYLVVRVYGDYVDYEVRKVCPPFWELVTYYMWKEAFFTLRYLFFKDGIFF